MQKKKSSNFSIWTFLQSLYFRELQVVRRKSFMAPLVGLEPTTYRLTAERSTNWAKEEFITWRQPIFSAGNPTNIFGTLELDFCVRYGNRYFLHVIITRNSLYTSFSKLTFFNISHFFCFVNIFFPFFVNLFLSTLKNI